MPELQHRFVDEPEAVCAPLGELPAVAAIQHADPSYVIDNYSPALCELIYRSHQRELLMEKLLDLRVHSAAATNSGWVKNAQL